jgi:ribosomal protein L27
MVAHQASALVLKSSQARGFSVCLGNVLSLSGNTDQFVIPGNIVVRQRGTQFHPGQHVRLSYSTLHLTL